MTKKHFKEIAEALKRNRPKCGPFDVAEYKMWDAIVRNMLNICAKSNPRFDRERFLDACGVVKIN